MHRLVESDFSSAVGNEVLIRFYDSQGFFKMFSFFLPFSRLKPKLHANPCTCMSLDLTSKS